MRRCLRHRGNTSTLELGGAGGIDRSQPAPPPPAAPERSLTTVLLIYIYIRPHKSHRPFYGLLSAAMLKVEASKDDEQRL